MKKVLIALDYDPTAIKIAEEGYSLSRSMEAEVILLHIITDPVFYNAKEYSPILGFNGFMETSQFQADSIDGLKNASQFFLDNIKLHLADNAIQTLVKEGDFSDIILKTAKSLKVDLIVLGTHSKKWLENIIVGSVAEKVLRHTTIPLYIIPTKKRL